MNYTLEVKDGSNNSVDRFWIRSDECSWFSAFPSLLADSLDLFPDPFSHTLQWGRRRRTLLHSCTGLVMCTGISLSQEQKLGQHLSQLKSLLRTSSQQNLVFCQQLRWTDWRLCFSSCVPPALTVIIFEAYQAILSVNPAVVTRQSWNWSATCGTPRRRAPLP